nr:hypothetical protein [Tanacetum cinerariifolium]
MMGNRKLFSTYKAYNRGNVIFGSNLRGNIIVKGQICNNKCRITFFEHDNEITKDDKVIGYSQNSKAYIVLNKHTKKVEESLNVIFDETPPPSKTSPLVDDDLDEEEAIKVIEKKNVENDIVDETLEIDEIVNIKESRNHPLENVIGNLNQRTLRNKLDENGIVSQNKARLVSQGYNQQEGIDYDETYALVKEYKEKDKIGSKPDKNEKRGEAGQLMHEDLEQIHEDDLEEIDLKWQLALLSIRARRYFQRTGKKITINESDTAGYDKTKVLIGATTLMMKLQPTRLLWISQTQRPRNQDSSRKNVNVEDTSSKAMVAIDGAGFDWSYDIDDEAPTNKALMDFSDSE